jgi:hypothetical protein
MVAAELPSNASLAELLSARARRTPRDRLALDIIGGALVAAAALWARPAGWVVLTAAAVCFAAYGCWALAEVHLLPRPWPEETRHELAWHTLQAAAMIVGLAAFALLLFAALGVALGPIKS